MKTIAVDKIKPSPFQPRLEFNLDDLKGSITKDGILVPLTVREINEDYFELIDGERRLRLAKELEYKTVPCEVLTVDDETADRMVWKVNTLRKDYKPKEKALHYKHHFDNKMSMKGIAREHDERENTVKASLNTFKLPLKYQERVWGGPLSLTHIETIAPLINGIGVTAEILKVLDEVCERKLTSKELEGTLKPDKKELEEKRIEKAQEVIGEIVPDIQIETPEDYDKAAQVLKAEAKRQREEAKTEQELEDEKAEKTRKAEEAKKKKEEKKEKAKLTKTEKMEAAQDLSQDDLYQLAEAKELEELPEEAEETEEDKIIKFLEGHKKRSNKLSVDLIQLIKMVQAGQLKSLGGIDGFDLRLSYESIQKSVKFILKDNRNEEKRISTRTSN